MLHAGAALVPHDALSAWKFEPGVMIPVGVTGFLYFRGARESLRRSTRNRTQLKREMLFFSLGLAVMALSLVSPIHQMGGTLFTAHMVQHELLMTVAAPLLVLGRPGVSLLRGLPASIRMPAGRLFTEGPIRRAWSLATLPLAASILHAAAIWTWHIPALYDASVTNEVVHTAQHVSFLGSAVLFWWAVYNSRGARKSDGSVILLLFATAVHTSLLGALLTASNSPWYNAYHDASARAWGLTALSDQQLGGIVMWVPGGIVYMIVALSLTLGFIRESGNRVRQHDLTRVELSPLAKKSSLIVAMIMLTSCTSDHDMQWAAAMTGGNPSHGAEAIRSYGCQSCHSIPGIPGAQALVGPPLRGIAVRSYIAGVMSNTPAHMIEWLRNPPGIDSKTAMPDMNITERDARDIAAYLYTLRRP